MTQKHLKWALLLTLFGATSFLMGQSVPSKPHPLAESTKSSNVGRYQIFFNPNVRADTYLVDTETGRTWGQTQITDVADTPTVWLYRERIDDAQQLAQWLGQQAMKKKE